MGYINTGTLLIYVALIASLASLVFNIRGYKNGHLLRQSRMTYLISSAVLLLSMVLLGVSFYTNDYSLAYVYHNSSADLHWIYRITAIWAGTEGSFLTWLFILNLFGLLVLRTKDPDESVLMSVVLLTQIFILAVLILDNPFDFIWQRYPEYFKPGQAPTEGAGMNPLLIDPWMVAHPPVLFLGYASATIPFGYAIAGFLKKDLNESIKRNFYWVLFSMTTLGVGIFLGGYWAYKVLGWGGYWGWDPVENSSLIPWLVVVALLHGLILQRRKKVLSRFNAALSVLYFALVFFSTYLTRSGVLSDFSVHSFGDSSLSAFLLSFILLILISGFAVLIWRFKSVPTVKFEAPLWSMESLTLMGLLVTLVYSGVIAAGSTMPITTGFFMENPTSVTQVYYNQWSIPFGIAMLLLMVFATYIAVSSRIKPVTLIPVGILAIAAGVLLNIFFTKDIRAILFSVLGFFLFFQYSWELITLRSRALIASRVAHIGVAVLVIGVITSGFHSFEDQRKLTAGEEAKVGNVYITFKGITGDARSAVRMGIRKSTDDEIKVYRAEYYFDDKTESLYREPVILSGIIGDSYITPQSYASGIESVTTAVLTQGQPHTMGSTEVTFLDFETTNMMEGKEPSIYAVVKIDDMVVKPGIRITHGQQVRDDVTLPGTERTVSLQQIDPKSRRILIYISPGKGTVIPADTLIVDVSHKQLIWLVWLGTLLITAGGIYGMWRNRD